MFHLQANFYEIFTFKISSDLVKKFLCLADDVAFKLRSFGEQLGGDVLKFRDQFFNQKFASGQDGFQYQSVFGAVVNLHVVVARVGHPEPRHPDFLVEFLFDDGVGAMVFAADDFDGEPEFVGRRHDEREVWPEERGVRDAHLLARGEQPDGLQVRHARGHRRVEPGADDFMPPVGRGTWQGRAIKDFLIRHTHRPKQTSDPCERQANNFSVKTGLAKNPAADNLRALLKHLCL